MSSRWAYLGLVEFLLTVTIIAFAVEEAITATTGMDRAEALGDMFFWLGVACTGFGVASTGAGWMRGGVSRGRFGALPSPRSSTASPSWPSLSSCAGDPGQMTFVIRARRSAASCVRPVSPRTV